MRYSKKLSDAVHILVLIALNPYGELTSTAIATSIHTNPGFIRQMMTMLRKGNLITCITGHARPALERPASQITLLDIYRVMEGEKPLLHLDTDINPECGVSVGIQTALKEYYDIVQAEAEAKMQSITLQDVIDSYQRRFACSTEH